MSRKPGGTSARRLAETSAEVSAVPAVPKWKLHLPEPYDNAHPALPSPDVGHRVEADRLNLAVAEVASAVARLAREFFASHLFRRVLAGQEAYIDALAAYRVAGFYTFVRDGRPTLAGLRGSRYAELIDAMGAANQLTTAIAVMFVRA